MSSTPPIPPRGTRDPKPGADPVLDFLGKMEGQIGRLESTRTEAAGPNPLQDTLSAFQTRLAAELHEIRTLREDLRSAERRGTEQLTQFTEAMGSLRNRLPDLIDETVSNRFLEVEERFHRDIKDIHHRSTEAFVQTTQARIAQRLASMEGNLATQMEAMAQLQDYHMKTDRNVQRLLSGLDRLTAELMRLANLAGAPIVTRRPSTVPAAGPDRFEPRLEPRNEPRNESRPEIRSDLRSFTDSSRDSGDGTDSDEPEEPRRIRKRKSKNPFRVVGPLVALALIVLVLAIAWQLSHGFNIGLRNRKEIGMVDAPLSGNAAQMKIASDFAVEKNYTRAENIYRGILKTEPDNREAIRELASVLFKQQRYEEAAVVLKTLPGGGGQ